MHRHLRKSNHNVVVLRLLQFHWKMYFQPLCSKISVQMVPVNFYMKGKCLLFFSLQQLYFHRTLCIFP